MKEQAGFEPVVDCTTMQDGEAVPFEVADQVVPPPQRLSMPIQRLEPLSLRRLFGEPGRLAPARIPATGSVSTGER